MDPRVAMGFYRCGGCNWFWVYYVEIGVQGVGCPRVDLVILVPIV